MNLTTFKIDWRNCFFFVFALLLGLWLRWIYPNSPIVEGHPYMADGDCYTRLHRVALMLQGKGWIQSFHDFENYPLGIVPHTTFPLDGLIAGMALILQPFYSFPIEWSGMIISPLLFVGLLGALYLLAGGARPSRWGLNGHFSFPVLAIGLAALPGLIWATPFGRPDHQSLLMVLIFLGIMGEERRWNEDARLWKILLGLLWGVALWTSLYEPLMVLGIIAGMNIAVRRREQLLFWGVIALFLIIVQGVEGYRFSDLHYLHQKNISTWFQTIGETRGLTFKDLILIFTILTFGIPWALFEYWSQIEDKKSVIVLLGLTFVLVLVTMMQRRWLYFSIIPPLLLVALMWKHLSVSWRWGVGVAFAINIVFSTVSLKRPDDQEQTFAVETRVLAQSIKEPGAIIAPWWISPSLLYFSDHPIVASTSHQSIDGIVDVSQFYLDSRWLESEKMFHDRKVHWIVGYDEDRVLLNASEVLGVPLPKNLKMTWAHRLWTTQALPTSLKLRAATAHFRLYEFIDSQSAAE
ncbi:MAG: hypothetical protein V4507_03900 [Verrucomicrobiota bacterium]